MDIVDVLEATEAEWAEYLAKLPNRLVKCWDRVWEVTTGEPAVRLAWSVNDGEFYDAIISMIATPDPELAMRRDDVTTPITYELVRFPTAPFVHERCLELEAENRQSEINYRSWFRAFCFMRNATFEDMRRLRVRLAQVANGRPTTPG